MQSLVVILIVFTVVAGAMFAAPARTHIPASAKPSSPSPSDSFFANSTLFDKKRWRRRMIAWWSALSATTFLLVALGIAAIIVRTSIRPGDLGRPENMPGWTDREVAEATRQAQRIITACYAYRERKGSFPASLDDLSPHFLRNIEPPAVGHKKWSYSTYNTGQAFYLSFAANSRLYPARSYASGRSPPWTLND